MGVKCKVYQDIEESKYCMEHEGYTLYFSAMGNMNRFKEKLFGYTSDMNSKFKGIYGYDVNTRQLSFWKLYTLVEKRGFRVYDKDGRRVCKGQVKLNIVTEISRG